MRRYAFIIAILGILFLLALVLFLPPKSISSPAELPVLLSNQKIVVKGDITKQTTSSIYLTNNFILSCQNCPNYKNKSISALCSVNQYNNKTYLDVLRISAS